MRIHKRQTGILATVKLNGACSILELAEQFNVSDETIRRNIKSLVSEGLIEKVHGGIVLSKNEKAEPPFGRRMNKNVQEKKRISLLVAQIIKDGDSIMIDTGSTTSYVARPAQKSFCSHKLYRNCTYFGQRDQQSRTYLWRRIACRRLGDLRAIRDQLCQSISGRLCNTFNWRSY